MIAPDNEMTDSKTDQMTDDAALGGPSAKTLHQAGADSTPNHQVDSKETRHV